MRFNPRARLDSSQIRDRRGSMGGRRPGGLVGGFGGGGLGRGGAVGTGGGVLGIIVLVAVFLLVNGAGGLTGESARHDAEPHQPRRVPHR